MSEFSKTSAAILTSIPSASAQISSSNANFVFGDVSKSIMIVGAGPGGGTLISKITRVFNAGSASIATPAFTTVAGAQSIYAFDARPTIQGMLNIAASQTESLARRTVSLKAGVYFIDCNDPTASLYIQDGVIFEGAGINMTQLVGFGANSGMLIRHSESINRDFIVRDMTLNGLKDFQTGSLGSTLIQFDCALDYQLTNLGFVSASGDAVCITGSQDGTLLNLRLKNNDRSDMCFTGSVRTNFMNITTTGSLGFGLELIGSPSNSLVNVNLSPEGSGTLREVNSPATSFVNLGDARFRTNDINIFGTSVLANPVDQLDEFYIGTVPFRSKGQYHAMQTVSGSRTAIMFPLIVNNDITGSDLTLGSHPGLAWVMDYTTGSAIGTDEQFMALMGAGVSGPEASRLTPDPVFGWTAFYKCSLLSGSQEWSGSSFVFLEGHITAPAFSASLGFSGSGEDLTLAHLDGSTFQTLQDLQNTFHSAGSIGGGVITDAGGQTIDVSAVQIGVRVSDSDIAELLFVDIAATSSMVIPFDSVRYVIADYNAGSPILRLSPTEDSNNNTSFEVGNVINESGTLHVQSISHKVGDHAGQMISRLGDTMPFSRDELTGGLILGESGDGNRFLTMTAGNIWEKLEKIAQPALDTSGSDTFSIYWRDGTGSFNVSESVKSWSAQNYDDGTGELATLGNNKYASAFVYLDVDDNEFLLQFGRESHNSLASAEEEAVPATAPDHILLHSRLIGRITFQKDAAAASQVASVFTTILNPTAVSDHGNLSGLSDDDHTQYLLADGSRPLAGPWNAGQAITSSFSIPSGSVVIHPPVDTGIHSSSFTASMNGGQIQKITLGADITIHFENLALGQLNRIAFDNTGAHTGTLDPSLVWDAGVAQALSTGSSMMNIEGTVFGNLAAMTHQDIS